MHADHMSRLQMARVGQLRARVGQEGGMHGCQLAANCRDTLRVPRDPSAAGVDEALASIRSCSRCLYAPCQSRRAVANHPPAISSADDSSAAARALPTAAAGGCPSACRPGRAAATTAVCCRGRAARGALLLVKQQRLAGAAAAVLDSSIMLTVRGVIPGSRVVSWVR